MNDMDAENTKALKFYGKDRVITFFYTPIKFDEMRKSSTIDVPNAIMAHTGALPGLYVIDDFITEGKLPLSHLSFPNLLLHIDEE
jgi:hypothetical protein